MNFESCMVTWTLNEHEATALLRLLTREANRVEKIWQPFWHKQAHTLQVALEQAESTHRQQQRRPAQHRWQQLLAKGADIDALPDETGLDEAVGDGAEEVERTVEEQFHFQAQLLEAVEQAIIVTNLTGRIIYWNRFAEVLYGWPAAQVKGRPLAELALAPDEPDRDSVIITSLQHGQQWSGEVLALHRDSTGFWAQVTASPIYNPAREPEGVIWTVTDISERKRLGGLLPVCASCKKMRDDQGYWQQVELYLRQHSEAQFSHCLCPDCKQKLYPEARYPYLYEID